MLSSLILFLIEVRGLFLQGGEERLRLAVVAFALGVILSQRLAATQGRETAGSYRWALGLVMALFTAYHALAYRLPVHPAVVFLANGTIFAVLWWVGTRITAACSVDDDEGSAAAAETGILARARQIRRDLPDDKRKRPGNDLSRHLPGRRKSAAETFLASREADALWQERLPVRHPGSIVFRFSLVAIPAFGLGSFLFSAGKAWQAGIYLFLYLWCALSLLFLSSLNQMAAYFRRRGVTFPDLVGLTWLALGFAVVTLVVVAAFLLPQPVSEGGGLVRERIGATYRGPQSKQGWREAADGGQPGGKSGGRIPDPDAPGKVEGARAGGEESMRADLAREAGIDKADSEFTELEKRLRKGFDFLLKVLLVVGVVGALVAAAVVVMALVTGLKGQLGGVRSMLALRRQKSREQREKGRRKATAAETAFASFSDPLAGSATPDDHELARYLWKATLAWCADAGAPCHPDQTPYEYLDTQPEPLRGFEEEARRLARCFLHVEFSDRPLPEPARDELASYWAKLRAHAARK